jgi:outer membrane protein TolC
VHSANPDLTQAAPSYTMLASETNFALAKLFRSGVEVATALAVERTSPSAAVGPTLNQIAATATVTVPLMQGRGGGFSAALEQAAVYDHRGAIEALRAAAADALFRATLAYWEYVSAAQRAAIQRAAVERSRRAVEEIAVLIRADERPRSDMDLMVANAASKQAAVLAAERQLTDARTALALAVGLDFDAASSLGPPPGEFPPHHPTVGALGVAELIRDALPHHYEIAAADRQRESARVLRDGAARQLRPRFDIRFGTGYTGQAGGGGLGRFFHPLFRNTLGPNASVTFVLEPSAINSQLRGSLISADAEYAQASIAADDAARRIRLRIANAVEGLANTGAQLASTREAVDRSRLALETVQRNFELGAATVFDRILAEDTVTNAELADLTARAQYAVAIAQLQFARGVVVEWRDSRLTASAEQAVHPPEGESR